MEKETPSSQLPPTIKPPLRFGPEARSFPAPKMCCDLTMLQNGHLLLASGQQGVIELGEGGEQVSSWLPQLTRSNEADWVQTVAQLGDGRAVAGVVFANLVVVLQRQAADDDSVSWKEVGTLTLLQSASPWRLVAHHDLIAVAERTSKGWLGGDQLVLSRIGESDEWQLVSRQRRDYVVFGLAITSRALITSSSGPLNLDGGKLAVVVDAYNHSGTERLWRHVANVCEDLRDVCTSANGRFVLLAKRLPDGSGAVTAINSDSGDLLRRNAMVFRLRNHNLAEPWKLSAAVLGKRIALAALTAHGDISVYPGSSGWTRL